MSLAMWPSSMSSLRTPQRPLVTLPFAGKTTPLHKPVLASLDIDRTVIDWIPAPPEVIASPEPRQPFYNRRALDAVRQFFMQSRPARDISSFLCTARSFTSIKNAAAILQPLPPIDAIGLNDGQMLVINHKKMPTREWLLSIGQKDLDRSWQRHLKERYHWSAPQALNIIHGAFIRDGFKPPNTNAIPGQNIDEPHRTFLVRPFTKQEIMNWVEAPEAEKAVLLKKPNKPQWVLAFYPDQFYLEFRPEGTTFPINSAPMVQRMLQKMQRGLSQQGMPSHGFAIPYFNRGPQYAQDPTQRLYNRAYIHLGPQGVNKGTLVSYLAKERMPKLKAVITAGDSPNDLPMLSPREYEARDTHPAIPNFPILVGDRVDAKPLQGERFCQIDCGQLAQGLTTQWERIQGLVSRLRRSDRTHRGTTAP